MHHREVGRIWMRWPRRAFRCDPARGGEVPLPCGFVFIDQGVCRSRRAMVKGGTREAWASHGRRWVGGATTRLHSGRGARPMASATSPPGRRRAASRSAGRWRSCAKALEITRDEDGSCAAPALLLAGEARCAHRPHLWLVERLQQRRARRRQPLRRRHPQHQLPVLYDERHWQPRCEHS